MNTTPSRRRIYAWALGDWANSAYATTVMAGFFPVFFKEFWSVELPVTESTFYLGLSNSAASLIIVLIAPILGAIGDSWGARKRFLLSFTLLGVLVTGLMPLVAQGHWALAALMYVVATVGFSGSVLFLDSLLLFITEPEEYDSVSALGYALGYLGGGLLFGLNIWMAMSPATFGLAGTSEAVRLSFVTVATWWTLFTLPLAILIKEPRGRGEGVSALKAVRAGFVQLRTTLSKIRQLRQVFLFLVAYWCYIDAVDTIVRMAVDYGLALGFPSNALVLALLITQFIGFPAALLFGLLGKRFGARRGIYVAIAVYFAIVIWASQMRSVAEFYALAATTGLVQGGIQSLSRSFYARLIPPESSAEFFGFYNMLGKFAAVVGPVMVGWLAVATGEPRRSLLVLLVLFALGAGLLSRVDVAGARAATRKL